MICIVVPVEIIWKIQRDSMNYDEFIHYGKTFLEVILAVAMIAVITKLGKWALRRNKPKTH